MKSEGTVKEQILAMPELRAGERLTTKQIASRLDIAVNQVTTQIRDMSTRGIMRKTDIAGKACLYSIQGRTT